MLLNAIADATPDHENYWFILIAAIVIIVIVTAIFRNAIHGAIVPPDEREDTETALNDLKIKNKPVSYTIHEEVGYDSHVTVVEHPYFKGEYYSSN